jgi:hypothetical protein
MGNKDVETTELSPGKKELVRKIKRSVEKEQAMGRSSFAQKDNYMGKESEGRYQLANEGNFSRTESDSLQAFIDDGLKMVDGVIRDVHRDAEDKVGRYWDFRLNHNKKRKHTKGDQSILGCRARLRDEKYLSIEWYRNTFYYSKGVWKVNSKFFTRGRTRHQYADSVLLKYAKSWEVFMVLEVEERFAYLRKQYSTLSKLRTNLGKLKSAYETYHGTDN